MNISPHSDLKDFDYCKTLLDSFLGMLQVPAPREVMVFSAQPRSGVSLIGKVSVPESGFCFFGWLRLEKQDKHCEEAKGEHMCVFRFSAAEGAEAELWLEQRQFCYSVCEHPECVVDNEEGREKAGETQRRGQRGHVALR